MYSYRCDVIIQLFEEATKVTVEEAACECGAQMVSVEYKQDRTKLPKGQAEMSGCVFCEPAFSSLVSFFFNLFFVCFIEFCNIPFFFQVEKQRAVAARVGGAPSRGRGGGSRGGRARHKHKAKPPKDKMAQLAAYFV